MSKLIRDLKNQLQDYQQLPKLSPALVGDDFGNIYVPNKSNHIYVRINGFPATEIYNSRISPIYNLPVMVGYDPSEPTRYQVLYTRSIYPGMGFNFPEAKNVEAHHTSHEWGNIESGSDIVFSQLRQLMPFRPTPFGGMLVNYYRGIVWIGGDWVLVSGTTIDYTDAIPATGSCYVLTSIDSTGGLNTSTGVLKDINTLVLSDVPDPSPNSMPLAAIRLYANQKEIVETRTSTDLVDLRWNWMYNLSTGTSGGGIPEAPIDGNAYLRENASWALYSGTSGGGGVSGSYLKLDTSNDPLTEGLVITPQTRDTGLLIDGSLQGGDQVGLYLTTDISGSSSNRGIKIEPTFKSAVDSVGILVSPNLTTLGASAAGLFGIVSQPSIFNASQVDNLYGIAVNPGNRSTGTILNNIYDLYLQTPAAYSIVSGSYGLYIQNITTGQDKNYAIYTNQGLNQLGDQLKIVGSSDGQQLIVKGNLGQTSNLQEWQSSSGTVLSSIDKNGKFSGCREILTAARTYYVSTKGNDNFTGLTNATGTSNGAFLNIQHAVDVVASLDMSIYNVTIQVADGTYTLASGILTKQCVGAGSVTLLGNSATPNNVILSAAASQVIFNGAAGVITKYIFDGFKITAVSGGVAIGADSGNIIEFKNLNFSTGLSVLIYCQIGGYVRASGNFTISSGASYCVQCTQGGFVAFTGRTVTLLGTPAFSVFALITETGWFHFGGATFSGSATGARYSITGNGIAISAGVTLPGNAAGSTTTGGQYV